MAILADCPATVRYAYYPNDTIHEVTIDGETITVIFSFAGREPKYKDTWRFTNHMGWQHTGRKSLG